MLQALFCILCVAVHYTVSQAIHVVSVISRDLIYATRHSVIVVHVTLSAMLDMPVYFRTFRTVIVILQST